MTEAAKVHRGRENPWAEWTLEMQPWLHTSMQAALTEQTEEWVMLTYRLPREPSTPRSAVWRKLRRLGVAQLADGLVALPSDARTREQLEWIAEEVKEADGAAGIWLARTASASQHRELVTALRCARAAEYDAVRAAASAAAGLSSAERRRALTLLRGQLRGIRRRDFFPPAERDVATAAVEALAADPTVHTHVAPVATGPRKVGT